MDYELWKILCLLIKRINNEKRELVYKLLKKDKLTQKEIFNACNSKPESLLFC